MAFFVQKSFCLNFFVLKNYSVFFINSVGSLYDYNFYTVFIFFLIAIFVVFFGFVVTFKLGFFFVKKHFLKLHYYSFCRSYNYNLIIKKIKFFELLIYSKIGFFWYKIYVFSRYYLFKVLILLTFFFCIFFQEGNLFFCLKLLPFYSLYQFLLNIYNYIIYIFNHDFDILVMEHYYAEIQYDMEKNEFKKNEYKKFLLLEISEFKFQDSIYLDLEFSYQIQDNFLLIQTKKYCKNKYPNDFFSRIKKVKPKIVKRVYV